MSKLSDNHPGKKMLALGNEAIARGAIEAGVKVVAAYPGTPSSEIVETLLDMKDDFGFYAEWSINEKVAFEVAAGASLTGVRAMAAMKGAGLNWAMDTFMTLPLTGVRGGFVIVVADDPGAHYSSNEQDSRFAALWAGIPCLEPENQQDALEMTRAAFQLSEEIELPVMLRSITRISHSSGIIELGEFYKSEMVQGFNKHWKLPFRWNVYGPPGVVDKHRWQIGQLKRAQDWLEKCEFNTFNPGDSRMGVIGVGVGAGYAREVISELDLQSKIGFMKLGTPYPLPLVKIRQILGACEQILVIEEGGALVESQLRAYAQESGMQANIIGKQFESALLPEESELTTDAVYTAIRRFAGLQADLPSPIPEEAARLLSQTVIPRSSSLCAGCPHLGTYYAIKKALPGGAGMVPIINGDIGCYEQAGYGIQGEMPQASDEPSRRVRPSSVYTMLDSLYVMGSGISMAQGQQRAGYDSPILAVAGDSTFFHATIPALINALWNRTKLTFVIMDNAWTAMTGHQPSPMTPGTATGEISIENVVRGLGVPFVRVVDAYDIDGLINDIKEALEFEGVAVVISRRECALQIHRKSGVIGRVYVDQDECIGCKECITIGCPAITFSSRKAGIEKLMCVSCGICIQVCPNDAIKEEVAQ